MFWIQGGVYFQIEWLAHKIWMLKNNFKLVAQKFIRCLITVKKFREV